MYIQNKGYRRGKGKRTVKSSKLRSLWIGSMFFWIGINNCIGYGLGLHRWEMLSLAAVFFVMAAISWFLERRKEMRSALYAVLTTILLVVQVPVMANAIGHVWTLILAGSVELLVSFGVAACMIRRNHAGSAH